MLIYHLRIFVCVLQFDTAQFHFKTILNKLKIELLVKQCMYAFNSSSLSFSYFNGKAIVWILSDTVEVLSYKCGLTKIS